MPPEIADVVVDGAQNVPGMAATDAGGA